MANPGDLAYTVKQQADIVRVIGDYVKLKKAGAQNFSGLCPFHQEKTPSFNVHATRQFYHCFGCKTSGDVFSFVQKIENITFPEAIRLVAQKLDIKLPKMEYSSPAEAHEAKLRGQLLEMQERACIFFEDQLRRPEAAHAREYLANRGVKEEIIRAFRLGYAPDSGYLLRDRLKSEFNEELQRASGLFTWKAESDASNMYAKFRNRIMFPIANESGKVIAFTGRTLSTDEKAGPKYLNSPETPIYSKSRVLYNLDRAKEAIRKLDYAIIVEGQMDCIAVYSAGFRNVIASSGTAFTEAQARLLARFSKNLIVNFDPDTAGAAATDRSLGMLVEEEFSIRILRLEAGFDPDLFIRRNGAQGYAQALNGSAKYFDYLIARALDMFPKSAEGKVKAVNFLLPHIQRVPSRITREGLADDIAQKLGIGSAVLRQELKSAAVRRSAHEVRSAPDAQITPAEKILIRAVSSNAGEEASLHHIAVEAMATERLHVGLATEALLDMLLSRGEQAGDALELPLSEADRQLLATILMREETPLSEELLEGALEALRHRSWLTQREREIKRGISEAERRNDLTALVRLKQEKLELDRRLAAGQE